MQRGSITGTDKPRNKRRVSRSVAISGDAEWQNRPLEKSYAIVYLDALRVKGKQDGKKLSEEHAG
jgi:hypothetical protein